MNKIDKLVGLLKRLNSGEDPESIREEVKEFLASIDPKDLSLAEQKLIEAGLAPEDLRHLCSAHMEMFAGELERMKAKLKPEHIIHTLISEHEKILGFLDELEKLNQIIQKIESYNSEQEEFKRLANIAEHLIGAQPHHRREEEVLFPELEKRGVSGPPYIMKLEHKDLEKRKEELRELVKTADKMEFSIFKKRLDTTVKFIILTLRDHIFKENNILYPTALQVITDSRVWKKMKTECDKIGYCCFTPK